MTHAILVIEGDTTLRESISSTLRREGYFVLAIVSKTGTEMLLALSGTL
jgi:DNA-binding response OmpR family regulator